MSTYQGMDGDRPELELPDEGLPRPQDPQDMRSRWRWGSVKTLFLALSLVVAAALLWQAVPVIAGQRRLSMGGGMSVASQMTAKRLTRKQRVAAATKLRAVRAKTPASVVAGAASALLAGKSPLGALSAQSAPSRVATLTPNATPDYFGLTPNFANSPLPDLDASGNVVPGTGIRKFVDSLPGLTSAGANNLGQYIPVANPDTQSYPGADYYVIGLREYHEKLGSDIPTTTLRGYYQINNGSTGPTDHSSNYLGPAIVAQRNRPVRIKFINELPTGAGGNLFIPVDTTVMGAGAGPNGGSYTQNRATLHLHGGATPWISDGTPHQWTTPASESTTYTEGVSVHNVPDMDGGTEPTGTLTFYYTNQQSARLMFYHDHAYGITRLNVYAGEAAPFVLQDPIEQKLVTGGSFQANGSTVTVAAGTIPAEQIPLVIQDKTFVPKDSQLASEDPTWDKSKWGGLGNLWLPHVYMPNQTGSTAQGGVNPLGRWDYSWWFYPPLVGVGNGPVPNPLYPSVAGEPPKNPGTPLPTIVPETFMDTPLVNGTAYPFVKVGRKAYRFRILNAGNDRTLNLQLYFAKSNTPDATDSVTGLPTLQKASGEVPMVYAGSSSPTWPASWPKDGRDGGVPDPAAVGPSFIQIGNEGGFLPSATVLPNTPVGYEYFRRTVTVLNVTNHTLLLAPAERADVIVDFSQVPAGSKLIMYNDAPAPMPGFDSRNDYYTGDPDQTLIGGAPTTQAGYGPNTRTIMQFDVEGATADPPFNLTALETGLRAAYAASQDKPIVPEPAYGPVYNTTYPDNLVGLTDATMTYTPAGASQPTSFTLEEKAIIEGFDMDYGRMNAQLGGNLPNLGPQQGTATPYDYVDAPTDQATDTIPGTQIGALQDGTQIWRLDHQGVDTHAIHFHLFNVQVIERVAIDGQIFPIDPNEYGWKETIRTNPGQDVIVALRPVSQTLPFKLPDSIRLINPALPEGATWTDSNGTVVTNTKENFGWEYVWHCHLLGHEENDMMRPFVFKVAPDAPSGLGATPGPSSVSLNWTNNAGWPVATNYVIQRARNAAFTSGVTNISRAGTPTSFSDTGLLPLTQYFYRVRAEDAAGYSTWTTPVSATTLAGAPTAATGLRITATSRTALGIAWTNGLGATSLNVQYSTRGATGPWTNYGGALGPTATTRTMTGLRPLTTYWIRIMSNNGVGSTPSAVVVGTTPR